MKKLNYFNLKTTLAKYKGIKNISELKQALKKLKEFEMCYSEEQLYISKSEEWHKAWKKLLYSNPKLLPVAEEFYMNPPRLLKKKDFSCDKVVLLTLVKNDLYRMKKLLSHYRNIGIEQFAIIDNVSDDGTREFLAEQNDVALFSADVQYTTNRREAWINRVISYYGKNRWYIIVDSDELFVYSGMEEHNINELIFQMQKKRISRARALMIDMYPGSGCFSTEENSDEYDQICYFDTDTYEEIKTSEFVVTKGGFRKRVFETSPMLTKYPIVYFGKGDIQCKSHYLFPYKKNFESDCYLGLLHYKFLRADLEKYREIAKTGNFFNGSAQYKEYISWYEKNTLNNLKYEGSKKYINSNDLQSIQIIKQINWSEK